MSSAPKGTDFANLALLLVMSAVFAEAIDRVEVLRRYLCTPTGSWVNPTSIWLLAGVLVLPVGLAAALPVAIGVHAWIRNRRTRAGQSHRIVYTAASDVLGCVAAAIVFGLVSGGQLGVGDVRSTLGVLAAIAVYWLANASLIWAVMWLMKPPDRLRDLLLGFDEELLEIATMCLGALLALTLVAAPILAPFTLLPMIVLRRSALVRQLQEQATRDARTGLLNAGAWRQEAERELARSARNEGEISLLMIDLDHFKLLNDTHGHQAGDRALKAVADCLTETLRGYDALGRYGGEEFAALLVDADGWTGEAVAERVCARLRDIVLPDGITVTASIGVATSQAAQTDLDALVSRADAALYSAKNAGRDRISAAQPIANAPRLPA